MDSPGAYPESPLDQDDIVYPCKGCGEILEEGKAFELAGNRWHIDCFRCNTCGTLLDSDANLLLLGDGSLICNNCTYSCSHCNNKIEDLAILTGDQAFCANCFRCRNCKRKIENLRYARTSQGIFCMSCHESLMARRRKKSRARQQAPTAANGGVLDKSLPALPPNVAPTSTFTPETETPPAEPYVDIDNSPRPSRPSATSTRSRRDASPANLRREASPARPTMARKDTNNSVNNATLTLPASTYSRDERPSTDRASTLIDNADDGLFVPFALDPNLAPGPSPLVKNGSGSSSRKHTDPTTEPSSRISVDSRSGRDYFNSSGKPSLSAASAHREALKEGRAGSSRSSSLDRSDKKQQQAPASPLVQHPEKSKITDPAVDVLRKQTIDTSPNVSRQYTSASASPSTQSDGFKLQDVTKSKMAASRKASRTDLKSPSPPNSDLAAKLTTSPQPIEAAFLGKDDSKEQHYDDILDIALDTGSSYSSMPPQQHITPPKRGDSLAAPTNIKTSITRKEVSGVASPSSPATPKDERKSFSLKKDIVSSNGATSSPAETNAPIPPRNASRPVMASEPKSANYTTPRNPPPPPPIPPSSSSSLTNQQHQHGSTSSLTSISTTTTNTTATPGHRPSESVGTNQSDYGQNFSPGHLGRYSGVGDFSMDDDVNRIMRSGNAEDENQTSVLRRVSNAVSKHSRSFSDRGSHVSKTHKRWPTNGSEITSPTTASPDTKEEVIELRNKLRRAQQRITDLETEKLSLQESIHSSADIKQVNTELREKRSTMAILDTQREMVIRELEIMTEHLSKVKDSTRPLDITTLKSDILRDFASSLQKLKDTLGSDIEDRIQKRAELNNEINNLIQMKDKGFQEYESLSSKNHQLQEMNASLVSSIQEVYRANAKHGGPNLSFDGGRGGTNGLGISLHPKDGKSEMNFHPLGNDSGPMLGDHENETNMVPQVINLKRTKPNKFNWRKGGQVITKNVTKGIKGAFAVETRHEQDGNLVGGTPYGAMPSTLDGPTVTTIQPKNSNAEQQQARSGWFGSQKASTLKSGQMKSMHQNNSSTNLSADGNALFGTDLKSRCDLEKAEVPAVVRRCIEEVEIRGMDAEGIYRKSGGAGQVNTVRMGFDRSNHYDISDPDLDIHAVTSTLKQYFRKLPNPLITFEVYDSLLKAGTIEDVEKKKLALRDAVASLPECHRNCLEFLVFHLARVMDHKDQNLMTSLNLAVVFAPTIMRPDSIEREMADIQPQRQVVQALLDHSRVIFDSGY